MASTKMVALMLVFVVLASAIASGAAVTCGQVSTAMAPCLGYLRSTGAVKPTAGCCNGVRGLLAIAKTTPDRQTACKCLKNAAGSLPGLNAKNAAALPSACNVNIPYKISTSTNCNTVK